MVTALDLPQDLVEDIQLRAAEQGRPMDETAAELLRAGLAASSRETVVHADAAMLQKRREIVERFLSGEWATEFRGFEAGRTADRDVAEARDRAWRG
jgi:plasmid stability protein